MLCSSIYSRNREKEAKEEDFFPEEYMLLVARPSGMP